MRPRVRLDRTRPHFLQHAASLKTLLINETKRVIVASKSLRSSLTVTQLSARKAACALVTIEVI